MQTIPIFFSVDEHYVPYLAVALKSIKDNASGRYLYHIHILNDNISKDSKASLSDFQSDNFKVEFHSLTRRLKCLDGLRSHRFKAFSSLSIYFRLFIPVLFPQYDKGIYLDADIVVPGDISWLWEEPLGDKYIGAVADYSIQHIGPFMKYIDEYVGVDHRLYVNSGVLLMNLKALRDNDITGKFLRWLSEYSLGTVAPDQDYLNALCEHHIQYLDPCWNCMPGGSVTSFDNPQIIHFNLAAKPWLNESVPYDEVFWKYAVESGYYDEIKARRTAFLTNANAVKAYREGIDALIRMATELTHSTVSFRLCS